MVNISENVKNFAHRRFSEIFGLILASLSIYLLTTLITYNPDDPNFSLTSDEKIQYIFGIQFGILQK